MRKCRSLGTHTTIGADRLRAAGLVFCAEVARAHHECWDGTGYPDGLAGEVIPTAARIVSICDVYSALREERPYKQTLSHDDTMRALLYGDSRERTRPGMFDPALLLVFGREHQRFAAAFQEWPNSIFAKSSRMNLRQTSRAA